MLLEAFLALTDKKLAEKYEYVAPDLSKARKPFIAALDKAKAQFDEDKPPRGANAWWSANNGVVRFTPKLDGEPFAINGETVFDMPIERFPDALAKLRASVEAGELDDALSADPATNPQRFARVQSSAKPSRAGWSKERREKYEATQAAKKAAKGA